MPLGEILSTSINTPCSRETFHQLPSSPVQPGGFLLTSVDFACCWETLRQLPSTFTVAERTSFNFCQLYMRPGYISSTFVNFSQLLGWLVHLQSTSVNFSCLRETFHHLPSTFSAAGRPSVNLCESTFRAAVVSPVNIPCHHGTFRQQPSTCRAAT